MAGRKRTNRNQPQLWAEEIFVKRKVVRASDEALAKRRAAKLKREEKRIREEHEALDVQWELELAKAPPTYPYPDIKVFEVGKYQYQPFLNNYEVTK